jgi:hypothetical protein
MAPQQRTRKPFTLAEHERMAELLDTAEAALDELYECARRGMTPRELTPLAQVIVHGGPLDALKETLYDWLYDEAARRGDPWEVGLSAVYYGVQERLAARAQPRAHIPGCPADALPTPAEDTP